MGYSLVGCEECLSSWFFFSEPMYMQQQPGFEDPHHPLHVCKLNQALYRLKQAQRAWFDRLNLFLINLWFSSNTTDPSLFINHSSFGILILLLYVDDMVVTGNNPTRIQWLVTHLGHEFVIKDLGFLHHSLGIEVRRFNHGMFLCQTRYAKDLLSSAHLEGCKALATPIAFHSCKLPANDELFPDPTLSQYCWCTSIPHVHSS